MSSTPDNILLRSRELWAQAFPEDKPEFLDLYFSRCYTAERNLTLTEEGSDQIMAAGQILPLAFNFGGRRLSAGYVSGLVVDPASRGKGLGGRWMAEAHRRMHAEGQVLSLLIPDGDELRNWYAQGAHGAYDTVSHRFTIPLLEEGEPPRAGMPDITEEYELSTELWRFYNTFGGRHPYEVRHDRDSLEVGIRSALIDGGQLLVARRRRKIVGFCLAFAEPYPAGYEAPAGEQCTRIRFMLTTDPHIVFYFARRLTDLHNRKVFMTGGCPVRGFEGSVPYAMARVVNVPAFLDHVLTVLPGLQMEFGVEGDEHLPANNGYYRLFGGRWQRISSRPSSIVTPGELAARFLGSQATQLPLLLDE